jgi:hypothetical protein
MAAINAGVIGSNAVREMGRFISSHTSEDSLIAYSICEPAKQSDLTRTNCQKPLPLAAYSERRFLHLVAFSDFWGFSSEAERIDFELSRSILEYTGETAVNALRSRGVDYVVIDLDRVNAEWYLGAVRAGALALYSNSEMTLLEI